MMMFIAWKADQYERVQQRHSLKSEADLARRLSAALESAQTLFRNWVTNNGGSIITESGPQGQAQIDARKLTQLPGIRKQLEDFIGSQVCMGAANNLMEANRALMAAIGTNKDIQFYTPDLEKVLAKVKKSERPFKAAFKRGDQVIVAGAVHDLGVLPGEDDTGWEHGFQDDGGQFYSREAAAKKLDLDHPLQAEELGKATPKYPLYAGQVFHAPNKEKDDIQSYHIADYFNDPLQELRVDHFPGNDDYKPWTRVNHLKRSKPDREFSDYDILANGSTVLGSGGKPGLDRLAKEFHKQMLPGLEAHIHNCDECHNKYQQKGTDWRPNESIPEDHYALSEKKVKPVYPKRYKKLVDAVRGALTDNDRNKPYKGHTNPMTGHCYVASQAVHYGLGKEMSDWKPHHVRHGAAVDKDSNGKMRPGTHIFLKNPKTNEIIDPTADQFEAPVPYDQGTPFGWMHHPDRSKPDNRTRPVFERMQANMSLKKAEDHDESQEAEKYLAQHPPFKPETDQSSELADEFHQLAQTQQQKDQAGLESNTKAQEAKQKVLQILQTIKESAQDIEQLKQASPNAYKAVQESIQGMLLMAKQLSDGKLKKSVSDDVVVAAPRVYAHPHAYPWHDGSTEHHRGTIMGQPDLSKADEKDPQGFPHMDAPPKPVGPAATNDQAAGVGVKTYAKFALPFGELKPGTKTNLLHYPYGGRLPDIENLVKQHGFQVYYAGGKYGKPDLANRNYNTGHLQVYDPTPESGGDFGEEEYTKGWRQIHELSHALVYPELNKIYGEGRRIGKLGYHRTLNEALRAVHWEWLTVHKQRELSRKLGIEIPDDIFNKELNTTMHDAAHRAVTGQFTEPSSEGFQPFSHKVPLETSLGMIREAANQLGLKDEHSTLPKATPKPLVKAIDKTVGMFDGNKLAQVLQQAHEEHRQAQAHHVQMSGDKGNLGRTLPWMPGATFKNLAPDAMSYHSAGYWKHRQIRQGLEKYLGELPGAPVVDTKDPEWQGQKFPIGQLVPKEAIPSHVTPNAQPHPLDEQVGPNFDRFKECAHCSDKVAEAMGLTDHAPIMRLEGGNLTRQLIDYARMQGETHLPQGPGIFGKDEPSLDKGIVNHAPRMNHLNLPPGAEKDGKVKVLHNDGKQGWVSVRAGQVAGPEGHTTSIKRPNG